VYYPLPHAGCFTYLKEFDELPLTGGHAAQGDVVPGMGKGARRDR